MTLRCWLQSQLSSQWHTLLSKSDWSLSLKLPSTTPPAQRSGEEESRVDKDNLSWDDLPVEPYYSAKTRVDLRIFFRTLNRRRWTRLERDYRWLRKEMEKMGLNPEDARFLL
jgi:hypothetical protein